MKSLFSSKTFWLAVVQAILGIVVVFSTTYPDIGWLLTAKSFLDIVLRYTTVQPVTL